MNNNIEKRSLEQVERKIPQIIHYCWFGKGQLPELAEKCIASWKKYCPGYEIIEWNEENYDVNACAYAKEAYQEKKWAFVSDYARFDILYKYGGLYFDTDVEIIKPIDEIVQIGPFTGKEDEAGARVAPGLALAAYAKYPLFKEILDYYQTQHYIVDGVYNQNTIVWYMTEILKKHGLTNSNEIQIISDMHIYPKRFFCPMDYYTGALDITGDTYSIHHYTESWKSPKEKKWHILEVKVCNKLSVRSSEKVLNNIIWRMIYHFYVDGIRGTILKGTNKVLRISKREK